MSMFHFPLHAASLTSFQTVPASPPTPNDVLTRTPYSARSIKVSASSYFETVGPDYHGKEDPVKIKATLVGDNNTGYGG